MMEELMDLLLFMIVLRGLLGFKAEEAVKHSLGLELATVEKTKHI